MLPPASGLGGSFRPVAGSETSPKWTAADVASDTTRALNDISGGGVVMVPSQEPWKPGQRAPLHSTGTTRGSATDRW